MVILHLNLRRKYFCEILDGTKKIEYREKTAYWKSRIRNKPYTHIHFRNGYQTVAPEMTVELKRIKETKVEYELHLGKIRNKKNISLLK